MRTQKTNYLVSEKFHLRNLFVFRGFKFSKSSLEDGSVVVYLRRKTKTGQCPKCKKKRQHRIETRRRKIRDHSIGGIICYIEFDSYRISCSCGFRGIEKLEFVNTYSRYTKRFEEKVAILCQKMTIKNVADEMGMPWRAVKNIDKREAKKYVMGLKYAEPKRISVDEIAYQKGHKYLTNVRDVDIGKIIWVGLGRGKKTLDEFFEELGKERSEAIEVAVLDMHDPYIASVREHTNADIVFNKFHVTKKANEALDTIRKKEFNNSEPEERKRMKKKRFLILARKENVPKGKQEELKGLMKKNEKLFKAYLIKEHILSILDENRPAVGARRLGVWFKNVENSGFEEFEKVAKTFRKYLYGIKNYFKHGLTNAGIEGFNTKINVIKRMAYGFHDIEYFMLKIIQSCGILSP